MKLPEKKYEPKHNDELKNYAIGWNATIEYAEYFCNEYGDACAKEYLSTRKKVALEKVKRPLFRGRYDCIVEIERLNEEPEYRLDNFFQDSLEALDKLTIKSDDELDKKLEELNKYNEDSQLRML